MAAMTLEQKLRSGHVRRWHIVAVSREQTIADHMHRVGILTEEILTILGRFSWESSLTLNAMRWAAIHDRHEFLLGDLPTPGKAAIRASEDWDAPAGKGDGITDAAAKIDPEAEDLRQCVEEGGACPLAGRIVALADYFDAMCHDRPYRRRFTPADVKRFISEQRGLHFDPVLTDIFLHQIADRAEIRDAEMETREPASARRAGR